MDPELTENPKNLWNFIKSKKTNNTGVDPVRAKNGISYSESKRKLNTLNEQFVSVFNKGEDIATGPEMGTSTHPTINHIQVTQEGVFSPASRCCSVSWTFTMMEAALTTELAIV